MRQYRPRSWNRLYPEDNDSSNDEAIIYVEYYQRVFLLLHDELKRQNYKTDTPHPIRKRFWSLLPHRKYSELESRSLVQSYINSVEHEIEQVIGKNSIAYWLHLYRRLSPGPIGKNTKPGVVGETRAALEVAIQKYANFELCNRVGLTGHIPLNMVLGGLLMGAEFEIERGTLKNNQQLVLTNFTLQELREFYELEKLVYELWRSTAMLRIIGKGASIFIGDMEDIVIDTRSDKLNRLVESYDNRNFGWDYWLLSIKGTVLDNFDMWFAKGGIIFLPTYNLTYLPIDMFNPAFESLGFKMTNHVTFNFLWFPFNLRKYRDTHLPFADAFKAKYDVELDAVLVVVAALCERVFTSWVATKGNSLIRYWQRAYDGPYSRKYIRKEISNFLSAAITLLNLKAGDVNSQSLSKGIKFWELELSKRSTIDLAYSGPHCIFLPFGRNRLFIDYTWIFRRLYNLFVGLNIPDQNFKSHALESLIRGKGSKLPAQACKSNDGKKKQIDAAFCVGNRLIIVECKSVGKSIGFDRGNLEAIRYRSEMIEKALKEVDEKAKWLVEHPVGTNYNISNFAEILSLVVTPFVEYIPSLRSYYWLTEELPRVLTPGELMSALEDGTLARVTRNIINT